MNAFDTSGPALTGPSKAERAYARKGLTRTRKVGHMSKPTAHVFSPPITTPAQADRTNAIRNSGCFFTEQGEADRAKLEGRE